MEGLLENPAHNRSLFNEVKVLTRVHAWGQRTALSSSTKSWAQSNPTATANAKKHLRKIGLGVDGATVLQLLGPYFAMGLLPEACRRNNAGAVDPPPSSNLPVSPHDCQGESSCGTRGP